MSHSCLNSPVSMVSVTHEKHKGGEGVMIGVWKELERRAMDEVLREKGRESEREKAGVFFAKM